MGTPTVLGGLGPTVLAVIWAQFGVATILFGLRIYTNAFIRNRQWNWDFWWALAAYVRIPD